VLSPAPPFAEQLDVVDPSAELSAAAAAAVQTPAEGIAMDPLTVQGAGLVAVGPPAAIGAAAGGPANVAGAAERGGLDAAAAVQMLTVTAPAAAPPAVSTSCSALTS